MKLWRTVETGSPGLALLTALSGLVVGLRQLTSGPLSSQFSAAGNVVLRCLAEDDEHSMLRIAKGLRHYFCQGFGELLLLAYGDL